MRINIVNGKNLDNPADLVNPDAEYARFPFRVSVYECNNCKSIQWYEQGKDSDDKLGQKLLDDETCWHCEKDADQMKLISIYEVTQSPEEIEK